MPGLSESTVVVELHDFDDPTTSATVLERFEATHETELIRAEPRYPVEHPEPGELPGISPAEHEIALLEFRPSVMQWAVLRPQGRLAALMSEGAVHGDAPPYDLLDTPQAGPVAVRGGAIRVVGYAAGVLLTVASAARPVPPPRRRRQRSLPDGHRADVDRHRRYRHRPDDDRHARAGGASESEKRILMRDLLGMRLVLATLGVAARGRVRVIAGYDDEMVAGTSSPGSG